MNQSLVIAKVSISEKRGNVMRCTQNSAECKTAIKKNPLKERDEKLDFYRGLAILNIVCIHTCFFSGQSYLPDILRTLCLLYDVPILVFLAGRSAQYRSDFAATFWGLIKIWIEWMFISTLVALGYRLLNGKSVVTPLQYLQGLFFYPLEVEHLGIFYQSMWYMQMYVVVVLVAAALRELDKRIHFSLISKWAFVLFLVIGLAYTSICEKDSFFVLNRTQLCFLSFFLMGYFTKASDRISVRHYLTQVAFFVTLWIGISKAYHVSFLNIQAVKFPPHIIYWAVSMISIITCRFLWQYGDSLIHRCRFIRFWGRNSLCFFFSQGIGAGLIYRFVPLAQTQGWIKTFLLSLAVNYLVTYALGLIFFLLFRRLNHLIWKANLLQLIKEYFNPVPRQ